MVQLRTLDYRAPESTKLLNAKFAKVLPQGIYKGFDVVPGINNTLTITSTLTPTSILLTSEGVLVEEDSTLQNYVLVPIGFTKTYRLVCRHQFSSLNIPAEYLVIDDANPASSLDTVIAKIDVDAADTVATQFNITPAQKVSLDNLRKTIVRSEAATIVPASSPREWEVINPVAEVIEVYVDNAPVPQEDYVITAAGNVKFLVDDINELVETVRVTYNYIDPIGDF